MIHNNLTEYKRVRVKALNFITLTKDGAGRVNLQHSYNIYKFQIQNIIHP